MSIILIIIIIILAILLSNSNSKYEKLLEENKILKEKLNLNRKLSAENCMINDSVVEKQDNQGNMVSNLNYSPQKTLSYDLKKEEKTSKQNKVRNQKGQRNVAILITGAICIVLSAIVFLTSTWNSIPNILKTVVLSMLTAVFFGGSYIAKEKFKLQKTSQTFFYIAMAYIPICLLSISIFELFGTYLSIYGEGKFIYLMLVAIFVAFVYYITYMTKNNKYLLYGSLLSQVFSVISFSLIFSNDILIICVNLLLYNILLMLLTRQNIFIYVYNFIPAIITFIAIVMLWEQSKSMILMLILLAINFLILELKKSRKIYSYIFNILLVVLGLYSVIIFNTELGPNASHLLALAYVMLLCIIENLLLTKTNRKNLVNSVNVVTVSTIGILHIESFINTNIIAPYIISILQIILLIIIYIKSKFIGKNITAILIPVYFIITGINIICELNCSYHVYIIFAILTFILGEMLRKVDSLIHLNAFVISHIFIALTYVAVFVINLDNFINDVFYALLFTGVYVYSYLVTQKKIFKYFSYITSNILLFTTVALFTGESGLLYYVPMISTLLIMGIELICKTLKDKWSNKYLAVSQVISFIFIYLAAFLENAQIATIVAILFAVIITMTNIKNREHLWNILPLTCVVPALFLNELALELKTGIMLLSVIATTVMSLRDKNLTVFTLFSGIYLIFTSFNIENVYLNEILFICWSAVHFLFKSQKTVRDIFKFIVYLSILMLYNSIIAELKLETYTLFAMLGYLIITVLTLKTILIKYLGNTDILDYILLGFIYIISLLQYNNEMDGMLVTFLIVIMVIVSYIKKYGAIFMVSIFAILLNTFALTREFWFSVPWWAYLLTIGAVLIGFAIKNEISDKKTEINALNLLKRIKERVDK